MQTDTKPNPKPKKFSKLKINKRKKIKLSFATLKSYIVLNGKERERNEKQN